MSWLRICGLVLTNKVIYVCPFEGGYIIMVLFCTLITKFGFVNAVLVVMPELC